MVAAGLFVAAGCGGDEPAAPATTTTVPDGVNCDAGNIVSVANETLGAILEAGLSPVASSSDPVETQALIEQHVPTMAADLLELLPAMNRAMADLRASLPTEVQPDADLYLEFIQDYATRAASIRDVVGFEATLALENTASSEAFDAALVALDEVLRSACGITLVIDRPDAEG